MTTTTRTTTKSRSKGAKPTFTAFHVQEAADEESQARWTKIGVFFSHDDGHGGTIRLDTLPINFDGRIVLRAPKGD